MSKKDFTGGMGALFGDQPKRETRGRPKTSPPPTSSTKEGTKPGETRATFIMNEELLDKLKAIAYWDRVMIKTVINEAFTSHIENYERTKGVIKTLKK